MIDELPDGGISIGAAVSHQPRTITQPEVVIDAADQCLYRAKAHGRNCAFKREALDGCIQQSPIVMVESRPNRRTVSDRANGGVSAHATAKQR